jgi:hypothetical protein
MRLISSASNVLQTRVGKTKLVVEPGAGRNSRLARLVYQFNGFVDCILSQRPENFVIHYSLLYIVDLYKNLYMFTLVHCQFS